MAVNLLLKTDLTDFLKPTCDPPTHLSLIGGKYKVDAADMDKFHGLVARLLNAGGTMPPLTENHTVVFPLYMDLDGKFAAETLTDAAAETITAVVVTQVARFYAERERPPRCVVLTKTGSAGRVANGTAYKHGMHLHFPDLFVTVEQARQICMGVINGLMAFTGWRSLLGNDPIGDWHDIVDASVYNGGLRMPGAPKATKCKVCMGTGGCNECYGINRFHVIDTRVYVLRMVLTDGVRDTTHEQHLCANTARLLKACTVRKDGVTPTPGYAVYAGCPEVRAKRKQPTEDKMRTSERRYKVEITDRTRLEVLKRILDGFGAVYANCRITSARRHENRIRAYLAGDNATYCFNKGGHHTSNRVYLELYPERTRKHTVAVMKCFCPCVTGARNSGLPCRQFATKPPKTLLKDDADVLFDDTFACQECEEEKEVRPRTAAEKQWYKELEEYENFSRARERQTHHNPS